MHYCEILNVSVHLCGFIVYVDLFADLSEYEQIVSMADCLHKHFEKVVYSSVCISVCVLVRDEISCIVAQFEEGPPATQVPFLPCGLEHMQKMGHSCFPMGSLSAASAFPAWVCESCQHQRKTCVSAYVSVLTFRIKVTPSSNRMPRSGEADLQRRKQSPSRRLGRMPAIWNKQNTHTKTLFKF